MTSPRPTRAKDAHVVFFAQYLPLHFVSTMKRLSEKVGRLTLVLSEPMDPSRDWTPDFAGMDVVVQKSLKFTARHRHPSGFEEKGQVLVPCTTLSDLWKLNPDVVISVEVGPRTAQAFFLAKVALGFKLIVQVRESEETAKSRGRVRRALRSFLLPRSDGVFVNGASGFRHVKECGVSDSKITTVPSGTDLNTFGAEPTFQSHSGTDELRIIYVGQLIPRKGILPFATEFCAVAQNSTRRIRLLIAGRGEQEAMIRGLPWPTNVVLEFLGSQPYQSLPSVYGRAHVFLMPSLSDEWGMVVNEAMACGLPVLGSRGAQAVQELVEEGVSGWTWSPLDPVSTRSAIGSVLQTPLSDMKLMGERARRKALEVSDDLTASCMQDGVDKVLSGEGNPVVNKELHHQRLSETRAARGE